MPRRRQVANPKDHMDNTPGADPVATTEDATGPQKGEFIAPPREAVKLTLLEMAEVLTVEAGYAATFKDRVYPADARRRGISELRSACNTLGAFPLRLSLVCERGPDQVRHVVADIIGLGVCRRTLKMTSFCRVKSNILDLELVSMGIPTHS